MDPDANLAEQIRLANKIVRAGYAGGDDAVRLAELVLALDKWQRGGGFHPDRGGGVTQC